MVQHKNTVFGIGTGRCGTESLATLLNQQKRSRVTHERYRWRLAWEHSESQVDSILNKEPAKSERASDLYGDVAYSWLPYIDLIMRFNPEAKVICLKRDKDATVNSWLKTPYNHWQKHDGNEYSFGHWSRCFPKFDSCFSRKQAIEFYWELYYAKAAGYQEKYPQNFKIFSIEALNNLEDQVRLLKFAGISPKRQVHEIGIKKNEHIAKKDAESEAGIEPESLEPEELELSSVVAV